MIDEAACHGCTFALHFDETCNQSGQDGDDEPNSHPVEDADAAVEAGEVAGYRNEDAVIEYDGEEHGAVGEDSHGSSRDLEGFCEVSVHGFGLQK